MEKPEPEGDRIEPPVGPRLKAAISRQPVPPDLAAQVRERIERGDKKAEVRSTRNRWLLAAAGIALCLVSARFAFGPQRLPALSDLAAQDAYIRKISAMAPSVIRLGLGDHIHCAVFRKYPKHPPLLIEMETKLGPAYRGLLPVVQAAVPQGYRVIMAHRCGYAGRRFVHLTLANGSDLLSVVITQQQDGETLNDLRPAALTAGKPPVYQLGAEHYQVAAFQVGSQLAFVVSELPPSQNLAVANAMLEGVRRVLLANAGA